MAKHTAKATMKIASVGWEKTLRDDLWYSQPNISQGPTVLVQIFKIHGAVGKKIYTRMSPKSNYDKTCNGTSDLQGAYISLGKVRSVSGAETPYEWIITDPSEPRGAIKGRHLNQVFSFTIDEPNTYLAVHYINGDHYSLDFPTSGTPYVTCEDNVYLEFALDPDFTISYSKFDVKAVKK